MLNVILATVQEELGRPNGAGLTAELHSLLVYEPNQFSLRAFDWPLAKDGRQHIHARIDGAELPVTHVTRRQGRPYALVLNKTDALLLASRRHATGTRRI